MPAITPATERLVATRRQARDAKWTASATTACKHALHLGKFADAEALADAVGADLRRERDLARVGLGRPLGADAHPEALRAAQALAGPAPALVAAMKAADPRRRALELYWEIRAGRHDLAQARVPRRLPTGDHRECWRGVVALTGGALDRAVAIDLADSPGEAGRWAREWLGHAEPSRPAGQYMQALEARDTCRAGQLFRPEFVRDAKAGHIAAMMAVCDGHRGDAERNAAAIVDPFSRALWRVRRRLVKEGPGWEAVARAAEAPGVGMRAVTAPLAWLRAANAWREVGDARRAEEALAHAGPRAGAYPTELEAARKVPIHPPPRAEEIARRLRDDGVASALLLLGSNAPVDLAAVVLAALEVFLQDSPQTARLELAKLSALVERARVDGARVEAALVDGGPPAPSARDQAPLDPALWIAILFRAIPAIPPDAARSLLQRALTALPGADAGAVLSILIARVRLSSAQLLEVARGPGLENPFVLAAAATDLEQDAIERVSDAIDARGRASGAEAPGSGRPSSDELRIALAEGACPDVRRLPNGLLLGVSRRPGPWSDYAHWLRTGKERPPTSVADPRIVEALLANRPVFTPMHATMRAVSHRVAALDDAVDDLYDAHLEAEEGIGPELGEDRRLVSAAEKKKKASARKAQKKARKAGRKK